MERADLSIASTTRTDSPTSLEGGVRSNGRCGYSRYGGANRTEWCTRCYNETYGTKRERIQRTKEILNSDYYALMKKNLNHSYGAEKPVLCYMPDGTFVTRYSSISIAAQTIGDCSSHIAACCKGRRKSVRGYIWKYECAGVEPKIIEYEDKKA